jgi:hypothetical protein
MRVAKARHSASVWIGGALALMIILQLSPFPGIYFMFFGGAILTGQLVHLFLASLFVESIIGRIPRALIAIPLLAYGAYYVAYFREGRPPPRRKTPGPTSRCASILPSNRW